MQRLHNEAAKDLQIAISKKPSLMPAYTYLVAIAKTTNMSFSTKQILDKAEENDKRTFYVRYEYVLSLQPRWGGSYEEMSAFAQHAIKFSDLNPRLWTLQGDAYIDRADSYYQEGNYVAAIESYTEALKFGDRVSWLKARAASYYKLGQKDEAIADYKRVLYYSPTDSMSRNFSSSDNSLDLKYDLTESTYVDPKILKFNIKSYAVLSVEHQVSWLNTRSDKGLRRKI
jgi:tetratricopeptide (TPR) repeat protein